MSEITTELKKNTKYCDNCSEETKQLCYDLIEELKNKLDEIEHKL